MLFKKLKAAASILTRGSREPVEFPLETEARLNQLHARAPVEAHLRILFQDARVGEAGLPSSTASACGKPVPR